MQKYPFQINTKILKLTAEISELVGSISTLSEAARSPQLRRNNRIKTIYSSLAIEQNTLSIEQVTAVLFLAGDRAEYAQLGSGHGGCIGQARIGAAEGHRRGAECL